MQEAEDRNKPYSDELDVVGHVDDRSRVKDGYLALRRPDEMGDYRTISLNRTVPIREFLDKGEAKPAEEYLEIFVSTRADRVAERECKLLRDHLVEKCNVRDASVRLQDRGRSVMLRATYNFTPKNGVGSFDGERPLRFVSVSERFERKGTPSAPSRLSIYKKTARMCETLRRKEGNCGLSYLQVSSNPERRNISARATLGILQRR